MDIGVRRLSSTRVTEASVEPDHTTRSSPGLHHGLGPWFRDPKTQRIDNRHGPLQDMSKVTQNPYKGPMQYSLRVQAACPYRVQTVFR